MTMNNIRKSIFGMLVAISIASLIGASATMSQAEELETREFAIKNTAANHMEIAKDNNEPHIQSKVLDEPYILQKSGSIQVEVKMINAIPGTSVTLEPYIGDDTSYVLYDTSIEISDPHEKALHKIDKHVRANSGEVVNGVIALNQILSTDTEKIILTEGNPKTVTLNLNISDAMLEHYIDIKDNIGFTWIVADKTNLDDYEIPSKQVNIQIQGIEYEN